MSNHNELICLGCGLSSENELQGLSCLRCGDNLELKAKPRLCRKEEISQTSAEGGVFRFGNLFGFDVAAGSVRSRGEGSTNLYDMSRFKEKLGLSDSLSGPVYFKHEGENPSGSFKDRGMAVAVWRAKQLGCQSVVCASTGNTSSSMAAFASWYGLDSVVFLPKGKISEAKMRQTLSYGAKLHEVDGNFDEALRQARAYASENNLYLVNSLNPYRIAGQMTIGWNLLEQLNFRAPDWVVLPGGNLGNTTAIGRSFFYAYEAGWIDSLPKMATIQAAGSAPFAHAFEKNFEGPLEPVKAPKTVATAIQIGEPVNYGRAKEIITRLSGVVCSVSDSEILDAKTRIDGCGLGCEPASAATLAGLKLLLEAKTINADESIVCILTGNILKS